MDSEQMDRAERAGEAVQAVGYQTQGDVMDPGALVDKNAKSLSIMIENLTSAIQYNDEGHAALCEQVDRNREMGSQLVLNKKRAIRALEALVGNDEPKEAKGMTGTASMNYAGGISR